MTTTPPTVAHDSATCRLGPDAGPCTMCVWAIQQEHQRQIAQDVATVISDNNFNHWQGQLAERVAQSAAAIRVRRTALLERADARSPTEGALALAEAWLDGESWYQTLPNDAMQDAEVLALAAVIEEAVGMRLRMGRREYEQETNSKWTIRNP